jgi:hypothetical protein
MKTMTMTLFHRTDMAKTIPYQLRLDPVRLKNIAKTSKLIRLRFPDTMRQAIDFGLPVLEKMHRENRAKK